MVEEQALDITYPLSPTQKGMLYHSLEQANSSIYLQQFNCHLPEDINSAVFEQAWKILIERHSIFRTGFRWKKCPEPQQVVHKQAQCPLLFEDWSDDEQADERLAAYLKSDRSKDFDFNQAPLMRLALFKMSEHGFRFVWTHHHIILDGRSYSVLFKELFVIYEKLIDNKPVDLDYAHPYSEYINYLDQLDTSVSEPFWREQLKGIETPTQLISKTVSLVEQESFLEKTFKVGEELTQDLKLFSKDNNLTLNTLVQAAWAILLSRYSGEENVVFGATRACRHWTKVAPENRVGIFINTLPLCVRLEVDISVLDWLGQIRQHWVEMRDHEHTPLTQIKQWSDIRGDLPLFNSILVFENIDLNSALRAQGAQWRQRDFSLEQKTNYPLVLSATVDQCIHLTFEYETERFSAEMIERMNGHLETILKSMMSAQKLSDISMLRDAEKKQLSVDWNETEADYDYTQCIHHLFEVQAAKTPEAIAIECNKETLTYRALNERANQLAHHLISSKIKPDELIGLSIKRSVGLFVAIMGILKSGAAYVPLDPSYPEAHLKFIVEDSNIGIIVDEEFLQQLANDHVDNPEIDVISGNLAYVIYTSGSTGKPKGALIEHKSLVNHTLGAVQAFEIETQDRILQFASISFDAAAEEIYPCLVSGARLILRTDEMMNSIPAFMQICRDKQITLIDLPTAYWHEIVTQLGKSKLELAPSIRLVIIGGEHALKEKFDVWRQFVDPSVALWNTYGPTEATIVATRYKAVPEHESLSIGKPIANVQAFILDANDALVPIGVAGELHIGGLGLARAYLDRPELTDEKFVSHPLCPRLYKTGDRVRYLEDGNIEFLGRIDDQHKIRGFRVEPGEIESVIMLHPDIEEVAVLVREDQPGNKRIVAYTVCLQAVSSQNLKEFVDARLPQYMVPSAFIEMQSLPLSPSGKIDRRALPAPAKHDIDSQSEFTPPRNSLERELAKVWQEVLGVDQISVHDNFFELGGHSLLAISLLGNIEHVFDKQMSVMELFQSPTISQFAEKFEEEAETATGRSLIAIQTNGHHRPLFFIGSTPYAATLIAFLGSDQPVYGLNMFGLHVEGDINPILTVEGMASAYIEEVRKVQAEGPYHLTGYCSDAKVAFEMAQQFYKAGEEVAYLGFIDVDWYADSSLSVGQQMAKLKNNFLSFGPRYLSHKIKGRIKGVLDAKVLNKSEKEKQKRERSGANVPLEVQHQLFIKAFFKALDEYSPADYSGNLHLLLSSEFTSEWKVDKRFSIRVNNLVKGEVWVEEVPGFHDTLFVEPQVGELGKRIKARLDTLR